jgi:hypothetical protein
MTPFKAYRCYIALKTHFHSERYDFFKNSGRTTANYASFERRNDVFRFKTIAQHSDPAIFILANFVEDINVSPFGVRDEPYTRLKKVWNTLKYTFTNDLNCVNNIHDAIQFKNNNSELLQLYFQGKIAPETMSILDKIFGCVDYWKSQTDSIVYEETFMMFPKYYPFLDVDLDVYKEILINKYDSD